MLSSHPGLRVDLLGKLRLSAGVRATTRFETRRTALLLARLALPPLREWTREELIELLWPDEDPAVTRTRFRQTLASLRRALEEVSTPDDENAVLKTSRASVALDVERVVSDVVELEACLRRAGTAPDLGRESLDRALELYEHHLMPGFYETWVLSERDRLESRLRAALGQLAQSLVGTAPDDAIAYARAAVNLDPLSEAAQERLLRILARAGRTADAARHWKEIERLFWKELRTLPPESLKAALESGPSAATPRPHPPAAPIAFDATPLPRTLPTPLDAFFGRDAEREILTALLAEGGAARLVTLTGPPGVGKTRLALEAGRLLQVDRPERTLVFVGLESVPNAEGALGAIYDGCGGRREGGALLSALATLLEAHRNPLLLLDNAEGVEGLTDLLHRLLQGVPTLRCLVTSQRTLQVVGEREIVIGPLALGSGEAALALLLDRARQIRPDLSLTEQNRSELLALCHDLDGLPLALELAAAWLGMLSPEQMRSRLKRDPRLLVRRNSEAGARHGSLHAALEKSVEHLTGTQQAILMRLAVFRGGWTLEAAERVCEDLSATVLIDLEALRTASLVNAFTQPDGGLRFKMLETVRAHAQQRQTPEGLERARRSHLEYFCDYAAGRYVLFESPEQHRYFGGIAQESDNLQAALEYARKSEPVLGARLAVAFWRYWDRRGQHEAGIALLESLLVALPKPELLLRAQIQEAVGRLLHAQIRYARALSYYKEAQESYRQAGDLSCAALCQCLASCLVAPAQREALSEEERSSLLARCLEGHAYLDGRGTLPQKANASLLCGIFYIQCDDLEKARESLENSLALYRIVGNQRSVFSGLHLLGHAERNCGDLRAAVALELEAMKIARQIGDDFAVTIVLWNVYGIYLQLGEIDEAEACVREGLALTSQLGMRVKHTFFLAGMGLICTARGQVAEAREWFRQGVQNAEATGEANELLHCASRLVRLALKEALDEPTETRQRLAAHLWGSLQRLAQLLQPQQPYEFGEPFDKALDPVERTLGAEEFARERERAERYDRSAALQVFLVYPEGETR